MLERYKAAVLGPITKMSVIRVLCYPRCGNLQKNAMWVKEGSTEPEPSVAEAALSIVLTVSLRLSALSSVLRVLFRRHAFWWVLVIFMRRYCGTHVNSQYQAYWKPWQLPQPV